MLFLLATATIIIIQVHEMQWVCAQNQNTNKPEKYIYICKKNMKKRVFINDSHKGIPEIINFEGKVYPFIFSTCAALASMI